MVWVDFFVHIYGAIPASAGGIKTLARRMELQVINAFVDGKGLELFARLCIEDNDLTVAAADKQPMVCFIERYGEIELSERNRPACDDGSRVSIDNLNLALGLVIHVYPRARCVERHGFERIPIDLDISDFFTVRRIDDADHRISYFSVAAAVHGVKILGLGIVGNRIRVRKKLHGF